MLIESLAPISLSVAGTVIVALLWRRSPRLELRVHKEQPSARFSLWEICLVADTGRGDATAEAHVAFYLSVKRRKY